MTARRLIVCADDFGLDDAVNAAVEAASRKGILTCASLMVGAPAARQAVQLARALPGLRVGLHIVLVDGQPVLPPEQIPDLVDRTGAFDRSMLRAGIRFFFSSAARRQLAAEIRAQFAAFQATGLTLDHVNAHKHMHIHPTVAGLIVEIGREFGMRAMRVPSEPVATLRRAAAAEGLRVSAPLYTPWIAALRRRLTRAGLVLNDHLLGLAWSGAMTEPRVLRLLAVLPEGVTELYCHPATLRTPRLAAAMPDYRPAEELAALLSPAVRRLIADEAVDLVSYSDLAALRP
ncbi:MAG TPA: hopanoid biosynthesis-associated protein HpnK [Stellaceae bacterium]|nr:hopanoid biosynthesis-associated protein HpnK [Stellaceae bacterium]